ncbi:MAG: hypothetical protein DRG24_03645 [Epsilonproteobacteria bacterium]|nr:MAG: hypothetical protein DRG24_03645 [Campylobacterota bacterium]
MKIRVLLLTLLLSTCIGSSLLADTIDVKFSYDKNSRLITTSYSSGKKINYHYDAAGNIKQISSSQHVLAPLIMYLLH